MISASILGCDLLNIENEINKLIKNDITMIHFDVMDGHFVSNITFGCDILKQMKSKFPNFFYQTHLMISNPEKHIDEFAKYSNEIFVHAELEKNYIINGLKKIKSLNVKAGIAINPETSVEEISSLLEVVDSVLVMTVNPGKCGQDFNFEAAKKIKQIKGINQDITVSVDGGINAETSKICLDYGVDILVSGSYVFKTLK